MRWGTNGHLSGKKPADDRPAAKSGPAAIRRMKHVIAVAQRKGGVGKTTIAVSVAGEIARRGRDVALIDSDPQTSACHWAEPGNLQFPVYELVLADQGVRDWVRDAGQVPADYMVIDTAPTDRALGASIAIADLVLVPCTPSGLDIEAMVRTLEIIDAVRARRNGFPNMILVPNRVDARTLEGQQLVEELEGFGEVVSPPIGDRAAFIRAFSDGNVATGGAADREIRMLCDLVEEFLARIERAPGRSTSDA
jgi:chromosome partitioning protein